jgi:DNA topoisomerase IB
LRRTSDAEPGITRRRAGRGFSYRDAKGRRISDPAALARIRALAIPPAYHDVWICADPEGHLQATGRDARGRKQYRYHPSWQRKRSDKKYRRVLRLARRLPALRAQLRRDCRRRGMPREKTLAIMTEVMMATSLRIGSAGYTRRNHSYGLSTLRVRHVTFRSQSTAALHFIGKGGQQREVVLHDRRLVRLVRRCRELPGPALFQCDEGGRCHRVSAAQLNAYLHEALGQRFSAKDFRTWTGTRTVIAELARTPLPERGGKRARRRAMREAIAIAAEKLGNTPAVCRRAYVCPEVLEGWASGELHRRVPKRALAEPRRLEEHAICYLAWCLRSRS